MKVSYDVAEFDTNWRWMKSYSKVTTDFYGVLKIMLYDNHVSIK